MGIPKASALPGLLGICFSEEITEEGFPYGIGAEYTGGSVADGLEIVEIPAYTYAVLSVKGKMPMRFVKHTAVYVQSFSSRAIMSTETVLKSRCIRPRMYKIPITPVNFG